MTFKQRIARARYWLWRWLAPAFAMLVAAGCAPARNAADVARDGLLVALVAVDAADKACAAASHPELATSIKLHKTCADAKDRIVASVAVARDLINAGDDVSNKRLACIALDTGSACASFGEAIAAFGKAAPAGLATCAVSMAAIAAGLGGCVLDAGVDAPASNKAEVAQ